MKTLKKYWLPFTVIFMLGIAAIIYFWNDLKSAFEKKDPEKEDTPAADQAATTTTTQTNTTISTGPFFIFGQNVYAGIDNLNVRTSADASIDGNIAFVADKGDFLGAYLGRSFDLKWIKFQSVSVMHANEELWISSQYASNVDPY